MMRLPQRASSHYFATSMSEKAPKFSPFSGEGEQKGNVPNDQQVSEIIIEINCFKVLTNLYPILCITYMMIQGFPFLSGDCSSKAESE